MAGKPSVTNSVTVTAPGVTITITGTELTVTTSGTVTGGSLLSEAVEKEEASVKTKVDLLAF